MQEVEFKYSKEFDGKQRKLLRFDCKCGEVVWLPLFHWKDRIYCNIKCIVKTKETIICSFCNETFLSNKSKVKNSKSGLRFCTRKCKDKAQSLRYGFEEIRPHHYGTGNGKHTYREFAIDEYGAICKKCGYNETIKMLDVDHIDSNRENNKIENLQVLCIWCHGLKTRRVEFHNRVTS